MYDTTSVLKLTTIVVTNVLVTIQLKLQGDNKYKCTSYSVL